MVRTWIENSGLSSRGKPRRNAGSPIRAIHRGQRSPDPTRVRFAPKATVSDPDAISRDGPGTHSCTATNSVRFNWSNLAYCSRTEALRGRFRKSLSGVQLVEQRLSLLQIERVETFGEAAVDGG